ncbi:hypothetical protein [Nocardia amikacinitolerans]|uniref:hypothetical protein n=1 Tax=Nocardia amikacinitolerans TaxID=756689 RepID=UPI0020A3F291|nr:hypothetical protein [Nocardia amikacinitolerans]MCP2290043.1 hypothetical protein [Nocardia amikacinitolerans]
MAIVDHNWFQYFEFARAADNASFVIRQKLEEVAHLVELYAASMAGNDEVGQQWGKAWDTAANEFFPNASRLADAYGAIANRAYLAGVNVLNAEWIAAGREGPAPQPPTDPPTAVDQRRLIGNMPTSIGDNGDSLNTDIPDLLREIGFKVPNGNDIKLADTGRVLEELRAIIRDKTDDVRKYGREPGPRDANEARLLYNEYVDNVLAPSGMVEADAASLAQSAKGFGEEIVKQRKDIETEMRALTRDVGITIAAGLAGTVITATGSDWAAAGVTAARVTIAANRIKNLIQLLNAAARTLGTTLSTVRTTAAAVRLLQETIHKPLATFEVDPDTGAIKTGAVFPKWKQDAWERYLADCHNRPSGCLSMEEWSKKYDQLMANSSQGSEWDREVGALMGYTPEDGWQPQRHVEGVPDRRYDFVHYNEDGVPDELVENKSGRLDNEQLVKDEAALKFGYPVTYNIRSPLSPSDQRKLDDLQSEYPSLTVNYFY